MISRGVPKQAHSCCTSSKPPLHRERHDPHPPAKPLTGTMYWHKTHPYKKPPSSFSTCNIASVANAREEVLIPYIDIKYQNLLNGTCSSSQSVLLLQLNHQLSGSSTKELRVCGWRCLHSLMGSSMSRPQG